MKIPLYSVRKISPEISPQEKFFTLLKQKIKW
nr:MAG TPA: hypothetical protein [Caudoviricetes sp.]